MAKKETPKGWLCGCGRTQPHYILFCSACSKGKPK
jgi:hypothetical protein